MQEIAVFVMVALATLYALWKFMPRGLRARLAGATAGWARRRGRLTDDGAAALARRLTAGGCGNCKSCRACAPGLPEVPDAPEAARAPEATVMQFVRSPAEAGRLPR
jgi:hypothetical protein